MKIVEMHPVPGGLLNQEFLVVIEHQPSWLAKLFGRKPVLTSYRGSSCWWHFADSGELITAGAHWPGQDYRAKEMLTNWYQRWRWSVQDSDATGHDRGAAASAGYLRSSP